MTARSRVRIGRSPVVDRKVPLNVRVRERALVAFDTAAADAGMTRSEAVVQALTEWMQRQPRRAK